MSHSSPKVFGIGLSKTGTTSLNQALRVLGFDSHHWTVDELTVNELRALSFPLKLLSTADALTDILAAAFYRQLDLAHPGSKFILTARDDTDWLQSMRNHMAKCESLGDEFINWMHRLVYATDRFKPETLLMAKRQHEAAVLQYFGGRRSELLVMPLADQSSDDNWGQLCQFLGVESPIEKFPKLNQSADCHAPR